MTFTTNSRAASSGTEGPWILLKLLACLKGWFEHATTRSLSPTFVVLNANISVEHSIAQHPHTVWGSRVQAKLPGHKHRGERILFKIIAYFRIKTFPLPFLTFSILSLCSSSVTNKLTFASDNGNISLRKSF